MADPIRRWEQLYAWRWSKYKHIRAEAGSCGFELRQWDPRPFWQSGLALAWSLSWCGVVMLALYASMSSGYQSASADRHCKYLGKLILTGLLYVRHRKGAKKQAVRQRRYSYPSPAKRARCRLQTATYLVEAVQTRLYRQSDGC